MKVFKETYYRFIDIVESDNTEYDKTRLLYDLWYQHRSLKDSNNTVTKDMIATGTILISGYKRYLGCLLLEVIVPIMNDGKLIDSKIDHIPVFCE